VDVIAERVSSFGIEHVVITGGEPLLPLEMTELTRTLKEAGHYITIETAGTVYRDVSVDLLSISPKLSNSSPLQDVRWAARHDLNRVRPEVVAVLLSRFKYQLKFVVDKPEDLDEIEEYLAPMANVDRHSVWLMPQAVTQEQLAEKSHWLKLLADEHHFRFSSRLHIEAFGNVRGK
jgi:7-carboxy-7-deazaguanine synthase